MPEPPPKLEYSRPGVINALRTGDYVKATVRAVLVFVVAFLSVMVFLGMIVSPLVKTERYDIFSFVTMVATALAGIAAYRSYWAALARAREYRAHVPNGVWRD